MSTPSTDASLSHPPPIGSAIADPNDTAQRAFVSHTNQSIEAKTNSTETNSTETNGTETNDATTNDATTNDTTKNDTTSTNDATTTTTTTDATSTTTDATSTTTDATSTTGGNDDVDNGTEPTGAAALLSGPVMRLTVYAEPITSSRVKFTAIAASSSYLVLGGTFATLYFFHRAEIKFLHLRSIPQTKGTVLRLRFSPDERILAVALEGGQVLIMLLAVEDLKSKDKVLYRITDHRDAEVTDIIWDDTGRRLFSADSNGMICITRLSKSKKFGLKQFLGKELSAELLNLSGNQTEILFQSDSRVVQLDYQSDALVVSTLTRSFILELGRLIAIQVGTRTRDGYYGACFHPARSDVLYSSRPGNRVWVADRSTGRVLNTLNFKASSDQRIPTLSESGLKTAFAPRFNFGRMEPFGDDMLVYGENYAAILDVNSIEVRVFHSDLQNFNDICVLGMSYYVLYRGGFSICLVEAQSTEDLIDQHRASGDYASCVSILKRHRLPDPNQIGALYRELEVKSIQNEMLRPLLPQVQEIATYYNITIEPGKTEAQQARDIIVDDIPTQLPPLSTHDQPDDVLNLESIQVASLPVGSPEPSHNAAPFIADGYQATSPEPVHTPIPTSMSDEALNMVAGLSSSQIVGDTNNPDGFDVDGIAFSRKPRTKRSKSRVTDILPPGIISRGGKSIVLDQSGQSSSSSIPVSNYQISSSNANPSQSPVIQSAPLPSLQSPQAGRSSIEKIGAHPQTPVHPLQTLSANPTIRPNTAKSEPDGAKITTTMQSKGELNLTSPASNDAISTLDHPPEKNTLNANEPFAQSIVTTGVQLGKEESTTATDAELSTSIFVSDKETIQSQNDSCSKHEPEAQSPIHDTPTQPILPQNSSAVNNESNHLGPVLEGKTMEQGSGQLAIENHTTEIRDSLYHAFLHRDYSGFLDEVHGSTESIEAGLIRKHFLALDVDQWMAIAVKERRLASIDALIAEIQHTRDFAAALEIIQPLVRMESIGGAVDYLVQHEGLGLQISICHRIINNMAASTSIEFAVRAAIEIPVWLMHVWFKQNRPQNVLSFLLRLMESRLESRQDAEVVAIWLEELLQNGAPPRASIFIPDSNPPIFRRGVSAVEWSNHALLSQILSNPGSFTIHPQQAISLCRQYGYYHGLVSLYRLHAKSDVLVDVLFEADDWNGLATFLTQKGSRSDWTDALSHVAKHVQSPSASDPMINWDCLLKLMILQFGPQETMQLLQQDVALPAQEAKIVCRRLLQLHHLQRQQKAIVRGMMEALDSHLWSIKTLAMAPPIRGLLDKEMKGELAGLPFVARSKPDGPTALRIEYGSRLEFQWEEASAQHWGAVVDVTELCPCCGVHLSDSAMGANIALFPCGHAFHLECVPDGACLVCFHQNLQRLYDPPASDALRSHYAHGFPN
eukprot:TRINITY_DN5715_c0_g1_i2.p1 TRINITY_DN5715_c0_g1~~TRINITY_DN5715_c0_g1_i2.p1  ORF type:complete len:1412 (-),score=330.16 TRINITY_DN5715_c0_g1_i2:266-4501(-)